ncbi:FHA domain-containing protein [Microbacterium jejuense]|uniref:FHA domain-containing protein n=1 Tax=Microbacterium jejuense TaxID=1263637 RepID=UPI0031E5A604
MIDMKDAAHSGRYIPTTTHGEWGTGHPRLIVSGGDHFEFPLNADRVTIGSGADADLRVDGTETRHAEIRHDDGDEYLLLTYAKTETNARPEPRDSLDGAEAIVLRSGAQFRMGQWRFTFARDEYADHGRPYGGRQGGEMSDQPVQPARPDYAENSAHAHDAEHRRESTRSPGDTGDARDIKPDRA